MNYRKTKITALVAAITLIAGPAYANRTWAATGALFANNDSSVETVYYVYPLLDPTKPASHGNAGIQVRVTALPECRDIPSGYQKDVIRVEEGFVIPDTIPQGARPFSEAGVLVSHKHGNIPACTPPVEEPETPGTPEEPPVAPPVTVPETPVVPAAPAPVAEAPVQLNPGAVTGPTREAIAAMPAEQREFIERRAADLGVEPTEVLIEWG